MPNYFAGYEIVAQTKNFLVTCEDDPGARLRAQNIGYSCEADLARLNDLFSTNFETGNTSPHSIWVVVLKDDPTSNSNGWNFGYETAQSSQIWIRRAFSPSPPPPPSLVPPDPPPLPGPNLNAAVVEFPRFVFVAELAEILMDFTGYGWSAGQSPGEGLSNLLGALLHPAGYYDSGQGPRINAWLNGGGGPPVNPPRADFVSNTVNTDKDIFSYGCAILFINYLVYQLGHSLQEVIRAGGGNLAANYAKVTGQPAAAAYSAFNGLLQAHIGGSISNNLRRDNIFPLPDIKNRGIQFTQADPIDKGHLADLLPTPWKVKAGISCAARPYDFYRQREQVEQPVFAVALGMANATMRWTVAGMELPVRGRWTNVTLNSPLTVKNPDGTTTAVANSVDLQYGILDFWNGSALYLKTLNWNGNCELPVTVSAKEAAIAEAEVAVNDSVRLTTVSWAPGAAIQKDWKRCNPSYAAMNDSFWYLTERLSDLKNRPDPPPERVVVEVVRAVEQVQGTVARFAKAANMSHSQVWRHLGATGGLRSADPVPPAITVNPTMLCAADQGPRNVEHDGTKSAA